MPAPTSALIVKAFGSGASAGSITNPIPVPSQQTVTPGAASYTDGFPPDTMLPASSGGVNPFGQDMNGILYAITSYLAAIQGGQLPEFNSTWVGANTSYALGALLARADGNGFWINVKSGNTSDPDTGGSGWVPVILTPQTAQEIANSSTPYQLQYFPRNGVNIQRYMQSTDTTQDNAFTQALASGYPIYCPAGTYLVQANHPILTAGLLIYGDGIDQTIIHVQATSGTPALYGFTVEASSCTFRDMTFSVDVASHSSACAVTFGGSGTITNTNFDNVKFKGVTTKTNNWGVLIGTVNVTGFYMRNCWYELLDLPVVKNSGDTTTTKDTRFINCTGYNCTDVIECNSPGGTWTDVSIIGCTFDSNSQFPAAFANVQRITIIGCHFKNNTLEGVHFEAASAYGKVIGCDFVNNVQAATFGTTADVNIITGSHDISIIGNNFDGTQNSTGTPLAIFTNAGSGGQPYSIVVTGNTFACKASGSAAVNFLGCPSCVLSNNIFINPNTGSLVQWFVDLSDAVCTGSDNIFYNPAVLVNVDSNSFGVLSNSRIDGTLTGWTGFLHGNASANCSINFNGFKIHRSFSVATSPAWETLFAAGTIFDGKVAIAFRQNGTATNWIETVNLLWSGSALTVSNVQSNAAGSNVSAPASGDWQVSGGNVQARCTSTVNVTGAVELDFTGAYYA